MNYDKRILSKVLRDTESAKIRADAEASLMRDKIYGELPRVAEIEAELRTTALEIIRTSFGAGGDIAEKIRATRDKNLALQAERAELLCAAGYDISCTEPRYFCELCNDTGYHGGEICTCIDKKYRVAAAVELNSKLKLADVSFDGFDLSLYSDKSDGKIKLSPRERMRDVFEFCRAYAEDFASAEESLFMTGGSGLGKTYLASCIAASVASNGHSVVYDTAFKILGTYEEEKFGREDGGVRASASYEECELLVIDDLGCEMATSFTLAALYNLINTRLNRGKKTIVISTLKKAELSKRYGEQMYSRLAGEFVTLAFCGEDVRIKKKSGI